MPAEGGRTGVRGVHWRCARTHDKPREVVAAPENGAQRQGVLARVHALDEVVRTHDASCALHCGVKGRPIQLHQERLVHQLIDSGAISLLRVPNEVLDNCHYVLLNAIDEAGQQRRAQDGVLACSTAVSSVA